MSLANLRPPNKSEQEKKDDVAILISQLMGSKLVSKIHFDDLNKEKNRLLQEIQEAEKLKNELLGYYCKFLSFKEYHSKWKPITRKFESKVKKLKKEGVLIDFTSFSEDISKNVEEAYRCYINGQDIAAYIMILRTVELAVSEIYDLSQNTDKKFVSAKLKLQWINKNYTLGADFQIMNSYIDGRNDVVHNLHKPTPISILAAFDTVKAILFKLQEIKQKDK
jgi:hypothetical protein